jgi:hypothetical protein
MVERRWRPLIISRHHPEMTAGLPFTSCEKRQAARNFEPLCKFPWFPAFLTRMDPFESAAVMGDGRHIDCVTSCSAPCPLRSLLSYLRGFALVFLHVVTFALSYDSTCCLSLLAAHPLAHWRHIELDPSIISAPSYVRRAHNKVKLALYGWTTSPIRAQCEGRTRRQLHHLACASFTCSQLILPRNVITRFDLYIIN